GVVQTVAVNNRYPDLPAQMRGSVAAHLTGKATVLERDVVSFIANEVRLDMAGLAENSGGKIPEMQFGFWIVDGFYQPFEAAEPVVQLKLRVERVLGGKQSFFLEGKPDEPFFAKVSNAIERALDQPAAADEGVAPTKQGEIAA